MCAPMTMRRRDAAGSLPGSTPMTLAVRSVIGSIGVCSSCVVLLVAPSLGAPFGLARRAARRAELPALPTNTAGIASSLNAP